jgi:hypothetical protein
MLNEQLLDQLQTFGALQFEFEDTLIHLDLEKLQGDDLATAEKYFKKGKLATEVQLRNNLMKKAKNGDVGATREFIFYKPVGKINITSTILPPIHSISVA